MSQSSSQIQTQAQQLAQTLSPHQILLVKLLELPTMELEERVRAEILDNPALEEGKELVSQDTADDFDTDFNEENPYANEDVILGDYRTEDDIPDYLLRQSDQSYNDSPVNENFENSDSQSFLDQMMEQARENDIPDHDRQILEYLIGNLDANGMMTKPLFQIADELSIYHYCDTTIEEVERIFQTLV
jgi:RNA polymerase sigma-54 factor